MIECSRINPDFTFEDLLPFFLFQPYGAVLESGGKSGSYSNWHFAACSPFAVLSGDLTTSELRHPPTETVLERETAFDGLETLLSDVTVPSSSVEVPFCGGGIGYIGYDAGRAFEDLPVKADRDLRMPHLHWAFYHRVLAYHRPEDQFWLVKAPVPDRFRSEQLERHPIESLLDNPPSVSTGEDSNSLKLEAGTPTVNVEREEFCEMVQSAREYIRAGDIYQVNLSRRIRMDGPDDPAELYRYLREANPAPYAGYIRSPDFAVVSSSPELFLRVRGDRVQTRPIKGTRAREVDSLKNEQHKQELLNSEKDLAELHMIVDLERNDLGRVCEYGSVETNHLHQLETFSNVHHLVGTVSGTLRSDVGLRELLRATFPGGSVTGAPKIRAMEIIDELEPTRRQVYTGSMGWIGMNGDLELNVAIRTMEWNDGTLWFQVGGGIVADSEPEKEYRETRQKARGMLDALDRSTAEPH